MATGQRAARPRGPDVPGRPHHQGHPPKQFLANKSNEAAERKEEQLAAVRGGFRAGDTVHFGYEALEPELVDGVWMIAWSASQPTPCAARSRSSTSASGC